jgi:KDO2-lipid IV(A) lauroyltransferase
VNAPEQIPTRRRWHTHGWNRPLSWELIFRVTPWLPRVILLPLHHATSLLCFCCMPRERAAARRNLSRVTGAGGLRSLRLTYRLFFNFSRFLVACTRMRQLNPSASRDLLIGSEKAESAMQAVIQEGKGVILLTMHLGQWDLGLKLLAHFDLPVHVVMLSEEPAEVARYAGETRALPNVKVHQMGESRLLAVDLMAALRRGELVAIQADRGVGPHVMPTRFFGADALLPTGPAQLAMATGAPILPVFVLLDRGPRFRLLALDPLRFERPAAGNADAALRKAMRRLALMMESVVSRYSDQWFNFYDVWGAPDGRDGHVSRPADSRVRDHA